MHRNCAKHEPLWNPGFRITCKISDTCFEVFHSGTRTRLICNVQHLKLAEPMELILDMSVNILPGRSQLYVRDEHLPDLQWLFNKHKVQMSDLFRKQASETTKPCDEDVLPQRIPPAKAKTHPQPDTVPPAAPPVTMQSTRGRTIIRHQDPDFVYTCRVCNVSHTKLLY